MMPAVVELPLKLSNPLNGSHKHWAVKARIRKDHRNATGLRLRATLAPFRVGLESEWRDTPNALLIRITRIAPRMLDPHDGLPASAKGVADGIADALGLDDRDSRLVWTYAQRKDARPNYYAVEIRLQPLRDIECASA